MNKVRCVPFKIMTLCVGLFYTGIGVAQQLDPRLAYYPESIIINGKIVSMDDAGVNENVGSTYQAIAVRDGRILSMGTTEDIRRLAGPDTAVYDVNGRTVIPGITDTHTHIWGYAQGHWGPPRHEYRITAEEGDTWQDVINKTLDFISGLKDELEPNQWVLINWPGMVDGLNKNVAIRTHRIMTRQMLDKANSTQRIAITGNRGVMNTLAMETYGTYFNGNYPPEIDPETGILISATVYRHLFAEELYDLPTTIAMIGQEIREWTAYGITTFSSSIESTNQMTAVLALDAQGKLATRVAYGLGNTFLLTMKTHPYLGYDFNGYGTDKLWFNGWSTTSNDGAYPLFASTVEAPPEIKERELLRSRVPLTREIAAKNLKFTNTHVAGDRALDITMDMIEQGSAEAGLSLEQIQAKRHGSDHCNLNPRPDQIPRLKKLGMVMSCNMGYIDGNSITVAEEYGKEYLEWMDPMRSIIEGGVRATWESDTHGVAGRGAFFYIGQMVNRLNREGEVVAPNQRINRTWALKTATTWAPYYLNRENVIGTLEEGKFGDIVVLSKDYFDEAAVPDLMLKTVRPLMTLVGGEVMYLDPDLARELNTEPVGIQPEQVVRQIHEWEQETSGR
jgi:predicted amidohydrolase YtcJ